MSRKVSETWGTPVLGTSNIPTQAEHNFGDLVFLKEADGGDTGGSGFEAGAGVLHGDSTQGQDRNFRLAGLAELIESCGMSFGGIFLFDDRGEDGESCCLRRGLGYFCWGVTGDYDQRNSW